MNVKILLLSLTMFLAAHAQSGAVAKEFKYQDGKCLNQAGQEGFNSVSSIEVSPQLLQTPAIDYKDFPTPLRDDVATLYFESVDAECVDLSPVSDFGNEILKRGFGRMWIQNLNLKGSTGLGFFSDFDSPRAQLEGAALQSNIRIYSNIAASIDAWTKMDDESPMTVCRDIKELAKRKNLTAEMVEQNDVICTTNSWPVN